MDWSLAHQILSHPTIEAALKFLATAPISMHEKTQVMAFPCTCFTCEMFKSAVEDKVPHDAT